VDVVAPGAYVLAKVDGGMLPNIWNTDQLRKYYVRYLYMINGIQVFMPMKLTSYPHYAFYMRSTAYKKSGAPDQRSLIQQKVYAFYTCSTAYKNPGAPDQWSLTQ
jgi:hypothetical protein